MNLKAVLRNSGYTMNDLWTKVQARCHDLSRTTLMKCGGAYSAGKQPYWNDILACLDEMGVDW